MKKKILITGISGFLGHYLIKHCPKKVQLQGTYVSNPISSNEIDAIQCHFENLSEVRKMLAHFNPDGIIHTAACSNPAFCQENKEFAHKVNIEATQLLAKFAAEKDIPLVFTSTDLIFDGKKGDYTEEDQPNPLNIYGEQKVAAEKAIRKIHPKAAICRMPLMLGNAPGFSEKFLQKFIRELKAGKSFKLFTDEYRSALGGNSAAKVLWWALDNLKGTYHLGGPEKLSRYDIGILIAEKFNLDQSIIQGISQDKIHFKTPRPKDVSLDISKAKAKGFNPEKIKNGLD